MKERIPKESVDRCPDALLFCRNDRTFTDDPCVDSWNLPRALLPEELERLVVYFAQRRSCTLVVTMLQIFMDGPFMVEEVGVLPFASN